MIELSVQEVLEGQINRYALVVAIAKRARGILDEMNLQGIPELEKPVITAMREFDQGKLRIVSKNSN
ncbi:MAG: DNA-directed RNA polymerase subunit omega [Candidatus Paraimprobicoccus trichonymphae]|uniref:DNA-directed RNA polymerase subunit omega n=1 Tax=Candidatus Paraimprobicoccus trichonymphae TaxID=3033793 RepID=A0AA48KW49_9FIRM|nr:MAG: DNA-directed RNA polymerase subunit omega [Candidatus Paraimprobicoccus trichonymphae]